MQIDPNIELAETLPASLYFDEAAWQAGRENIFAGTWQWVGDEKHIFRGPNNIFPFSLHPGYLDDPLILVKRKDGSMKCLSNVCTHRGFILYREPARTKKLLCRYHGRRFSTGGRFEFMPEFQEARDFPRQCDDLAELPLSKWRRFLFTACKPAFDFERVFGIMDEKVGFLPVEDFTFRPEYTQEYPTKAHWALYCDNFLEGFHIPFVHETLNDMLDYGDYTTEVFDHMILQTGFADGDTPVFDFPEGHPDRGRNVSAYYFWIFPNLMFNFYPWGLQVNVVHPVSMDRCKVMFYHYLYDEEIFTRMNALHVAELTQREDEMVVEAVQTGLSSRFYDTGRFSPKREKGVHYFHLLLSQYLSGDFPAGS
jgi:choline monooxygenase